VQGVGSKVYGLLAVKRNQDKIRLSGLDKLLYYAFTLILTQIITYDFIRRN